VSVTPLTSYLDIPLSSHYSFKACERVCNPGHSKHFSQELISLVYSSSIYQAGKNPLATQTKNSFNSSHYQPQTTKQHSPSWEFVKGPKGTQIAGQTSRENLELVRDEVEGYNHI
jgi:hypothetical protein